jgi:hypothetical protein
MSLLSRFMHRLRSPLKVIGKPKVLKFKRPVASGVARLFGARGRLIAMGAASCNYGF